MRFPSSGWSAARDTALLSMLLVCLVPLAAFGQPSDDGYLAGYVAAVLERQLNVSPRSLKVKDGVVTIDAADVPRADRPKIMTAITAVRGVTRVEIREGAQPVTVGAGRDGARGDIRAGDGVLGDRLSADGSPLPAAHRRSALAPLLGRVPVLHRPRRGRKT